MKRRTESACPVRSVLNSVGSKWSILIIDILGNTESMRFNEINKTVSAQHGCHYTDITNETRKAKDDASLLTADNLHYSAKEHAVWSAYVSELIERIMKDK